MTAFDTAAAIITSLEYEDPTSIDVTLTDPPALAYTLDDGRTRVIRLQRAQIVSIVDALWHDVHDPKGG